MNFFPNSGIASATNTTKFSLEFTVQAAGTEFIIDPSLSSAASTSYMIIGTGTTTLSSARAAQIVDGGVNGTASTYIPQTNRIIYFTGVSTDINSETISGLQEYFTNIPAIADGARAVAFAIGGTNALSCVRVEAEFIKTSATGGDVSTKLVVSNGVDLGPRIKDDSGTMRVTYANNPLVTCNGVIFGNFLVPDGDSTGFGAPPAAGDKCILTITTH